LEINETETMKALCRPLAVMACFCLFALTACGQRGDLTLPKAEVNQPSATIPANDSTEPVQQTAPTTIRPQTATDHHSSTNR
jgi:predicted small lipoprotein YifL